MPDTPLRTHLQPLIRDAINEPPPLRKTTLDALRNIARWHGKGPYKYRPDSMLILADLGYVERVGGTEATPHWRITEAGKQRVAR